MHLLYCKDFYKVDHIRQYPAKTQLIFNNFTARKSRIKDINKVVFHGLNYLIDRYFDTEDFLDFEPKEYKFLMKAFLDLNIDVTHLEKLKSYVKNQNTLPINIYALPELSIVPIGVPMLVMFNIHPDFFWLPQMLETIMSCTLWSACTSATLARQFRTLLDRYAAITSDMPEFVDYQAHDFSMRGMSSLESALISGAAHLQYFKGTDCIPAIFHNTAYFQYSKIPISVPATEHSVMSAGGKDNEYETFHRLITEIYPSSIISIVSDTWNLWKVMDEYLPALKNDIMQRNGKVVIRPDSGDPVEIICGRPKTDISDVSLPAKGVVEALWDIFGGTVNSKGYKQLDPHIGVIYGDSITLDIAKEICERLKEKGFASTNIVFGIGSYTYQYNTCDTFNFAMKATYAEIDGKGIALTKDPITDDGTKKSHSGILKVIKVEGAHGSSYQVLENQTWDQFHQPDNELKRIY